MSTKSNPSQLSSGQFQPRSERPDCNQLRIQPRQLNKQVYQQALAEGVHPLLAKIFAGRLQQTPPSLNGLIQPGLQQLAAPDSLADIQPAVERLVSAVLGGETIGLLTDYDVDGITAHVVIYRCLTEICQVAPSKLQSLIGHSIEDGYGVSASLTDRILASPQRPSLIITADCGSSDEPQLARLQAAGIDVIVTDHHALPPQGPPASALAVINPTRADCQYPDKTLAGCAVAWLLMSALRSALVAAYTIPASTPKLSYLLPFVALGTVADCVSLGGSAMNRAFINAGLQLMNASEAACWQAFRQLMGSRFNGFDASTLGFQLGPRINASSRMADPYAALNFLLASQPDQAAQYLELLDSDNQERRQVEALMLQQALGAAEQQVAAGLRSLVTYLDQGHAGVQGIVASRLVEKYGRPAVVLTPSQEAGQLTASARSVTDIDLHAALHRVNRLHPGILVKFGGHKAAAGLSLWQERLADFQQALEQAVAGQIGTKQLGPVVFTDGELDADLLNLDTLALLQQLEPYGREFEAPVFAGTFTLLAARAVGAEPIHVQMEVLPLGASSSTPQPLKAIWFRALPKTGAPLPLKVGAPASLVYQLAENTFRNQTSLQLVVSQAQTLS